MRGHRNHGNGVEGSRVEVSAEKSGRIGDPMAAWLPDSETRTIAFNYRVERKLGGLPDQKPGLRFCQRNL